MRRVHRPARLRRVHGSESARRSSRDVRPLSLRPLTLPGALAAALLLGGLACEPAAPPRRQPNVVLITIDTLRADRMSMYGYERDTTPRLDSFFASGTILEGTTSSAPCTVPAVRQLLTGRLDRAAEGTSLPEALAAAGYATAAVVSQHQFHWDGLPNYARGFSVFDVQAKDEIDSYKMTTRTASEVSDRAVAWLDANAQKEPFFLWLHYFDPHDPYTSPDEYDRFDRGTSSAAKGDRRAADPVKREPHADDPTVLSEVFSETDAAHFRNRYDAEILYTDAEIGRVLDRMEVLDLVDSSVVALTSDHAERLGETPLWGHCKTLHGFETGIPLALRHRGGKVPIADGTASGTLDVTPTLLRLAGVPFAADRYHGIDLTAPAASSHVAPSIWRGKRTLSDGAWRLYLDMEGTPTALFDVTRDFEETENVLPQHPEIAKRLLAADDVSGPAAEQSAEVTRRTFDRLKSLGYIQ